MLCKEDLLIIGILIFVIIFIYDQLKNLICGKKEGFQSTASGYQADVEAIRNLSSIATQLTTNNTLTNPGSLKIASKLSTNNLDPNNMPDGWGGGIRTFDLYSSGTIACGSDGKNIKAFMNSNGDLKIGSWLLRDKNGHLQFIKDGTNYNDDYTKIPDNQGFIAMSQDGNLWATRSSSRGWVCDNVGGKINRSGDTMNGDLFMNDNAIKLRGNGDHNHYIKFNAVTDGPEIAGCGGINITRTCGASENPYIRLNNWVLYPRDSDKFLIKNSHDINTETTKKFLFLDTNILTHHTDGQNNGGSYTYYKPISRLTDRVAILTNTYNKL